MEQVKNKSPAKEKKIDAAAELQSISIKQKLLESQKEFFEPESPINKNRNTSKMGDKLEQTPLVGTLVSSSEAELEIEIDNSNEFLNL